jgi:hypothetical protein
LGPISVPEHLPQAPKDNNARILRLRDVLLVAHGTQRSAPAPYLLWRLAPLPALGADPVLRFVRRAPVLVVAQTGAQALLFGDQPDYHEGFLPLREAPPDSPAAARHERYELLPSFRRADTGEEVHSALFEPIDWEWML